MLNAKSLKENIERINTEMGATKKLLAQLEKLLVAYNAQQLQLATCIAASEKLFDAYLAAKKTNPNLELGPATKQMQEVQMSFNLQYLELQSQMQHENRSYTAVSNIMKTKHDTVKNSLPNIR